MRIALSFCSLFAVIAAVGRADYAVLDHYKIGGAAWSYDYVVADASARRLYVAHEKQFEVLDLDSGKKIGEIGPATRAHGVAIAADAGHGFATSGIDDQIIMFDLKSLAPIRQFKSPGSNPDGIEYDPDTKRIYVANHGSGQVTVLDPATGEVVGNVAFDADAKLEGLGFDGRGQGFVNDEEHSAVLVFDTHALKPKAKWSSAPGEGGTGLAVDAANHRVFSACGNKKLVVLDSDSGKVVTTVAIGEDPDGLAFDPARHRLFTPNPEGTMSIVQQASADKYTVVQTLTTAQAARTVGFDPKTGRVFTCAPKFGEKPPQKKGGPKARAPILAGTFEVLAIGEK